ncbi:MAG: DEAD/DEAH box helicase family protein, partial [Enterococcus faecalis]|nr:DEAD/DEAH box helicase family protein [Enterococcus faecalis]MDU2350649.1 DEAD/DEAH box helicase family protein [Enterococcus faecalis]MDU2442773.1 DEAD/DEAH box helicase family protein [Veillonella sp.]
MKLRPYQEEARSAVQNEWQNNKKKTLLVLPTGCGKTIVFSKIIEDRVRAGERVLVLAHRGELLDQASDKLEKSTGLKTATEKAEQTSLGSFLRVVVGSVQTMQREKRLSKFPPDYFDTIVVDEAHHCISEGYQRVLKHFDESNVLGVTATPDRG